MKKYGIFKIRPWIQGLWTLLTNSHIAGFFNGSIFTGRPKSVCVPGLNCYSCPGAVGSCPVGSLQAVLGGRKHNFSFYVIGILMLFGAVFGRVICGFLCPFGLVQQLLNKIPLPKRKLKVPELVDRPLRYVKYGVFLIMVIVLPIFAVNQFGMAPPYFCKWICPAGTLGGGIPLVTVNEGLRNAIGALFNWKLALLILTIAASILIYRPFCKYICPLGAFYALFNRISIMRMELDRHNCINCGACERACPMQVDVRRNINSTECIRCGACAKSCGVGAIKLKFGRPTIDTGYVKKDEETASAR